jgi:hypothetical protein
MAVPRRSVRRAGCFGPDQAKIREAENHQLDREGREQQAGDLGDHLQRRGATSMRSTIVLVVLVP